MSSPDTIAAIASAPGRGAVGVIRVSGPGVPHIAQEILGFLPMPRLAQVANFRSSSGEALDRGLALYFPAPASYTGEHVLELQGHGGALIMDLLLQRLLGMGCRMARPGEFSERAFLNGKIDIAQAEAIADLIDAGTTAAARAAVRSMQGEFSARINALQVQITELRTLVEAAIDFPDEELEFLPGSVLGRRMANILAGFESITAAARQGALLREGLNVVIAGRPNAGKSSLLNYLVGDEIAIVTDQPGTTRDVLRQHVHLDGLPLNLIDTAGLRTAVDVVEAEGVRRALNEVDRADRVLYILDHAAARPQDWRAELQELPPGVPLTLVFNKIDLSGAAPRADESPDPPQVFLSAKTGEGVALLREHLKTRAGYVSGESGALSARRRHLDALRRAKACVEQAAQTLAETRAFELFAEELRRAQLALGEITGEFTSDDLLGEIFS
ncbi:MAG: tRNA modification GTPase, partial [Gammaproteobacteria bacterium]|nr:tRNA modification GTPase [Gammaproteobacteria bacterium]